MLSRASLLCRRSAARPGAGAAASTSTSTSSRNLHACSLSPASCITSPSILANGPFHHRPPLLSSHQTHLYQTRQTLTLQTPTTTTIRHFAGRKDRASTSFETRPPTKKQRKKYHKRRRALEYEQTKHSKPGSKAVHRRREKEERQARLVEIAQEEEMLKGQLSAYFDKVNELQQKIEASPKFQALLEEGKIPPEQIHAAARDAAKKAAEKSDTPHPPLPTWWQDRMTYDWGDALMDDLMGNSADLTSSANPYPVYMGGEYGRLRRKVERMLRGQREEERFLLESRKRAENGLSTGAAVSDIPPLSLTEESATAAAEVGGQSNQVPEIQRPKNAVSDKLLSDLIRAYRDANGKRTSPIGLGPTLEMLQDLDIPLSSLKTYSYVSLLTCCKSPWEARKLNEFRKEHGVRSSEYFWSALVDVYARSGDYRGAEQVLDEMLEESEHEFHNTDVYGKNDSITEEKNVVPKQPIAIPPLPAYTSFFSACYKLIARSDVHHSIKADAGSRAWSRWKEMRIHSVPPDVMAYGALMRIFAAQGRPEQAIDLLDEIMMQMMLPVNADNVWDKNGELTTEEVLRNADGDDDGWYDDRDGKTVRVKPTTLLFTSALKAVAKSHENANRFSGGLSKKNRKRESIASYHGRLTRKIVVLAEQAEVKQDDGFVSALMLCSAAAGDSSTARAIYLASRVRRLDHLRTCGGKDHLKRLQGLIPEEEKQKLLGGDGGGDESTLALSSGSSPNNMPALRTIEEEFEEDHAAYEDREYGTDTRILSTLLLAHSKAMETKGLGSMWAGRYNRGYLCHNSLRYMEAYNQPQYENMAIPGLDSVKAGLSPEGYEPEDFEDDGRGKQTSSKQLRKKHKFNIKQIMGDGEGNRRDEQDEFFDGFDEDPDQWKRDLYSPTRNRDEQQLQLNGGVETEEVSRDWLNDRLFDKNDERLLIGTSSEDGEMSTLSYRPGQDSVDNEELSQDDKDDGEYFGNDFDSDSDDDSDDEVEGEDSDDEAEEEDTLDAPLDSSGTIIRHGGFSEPQTDRDALVKAMAEVTGDMELAEDVIPKELDFGPGGADGEGNDDFDPDTYFDEDEFNKLMEDTMRGMDDSKGGDAEELNSIPGVATNDFAAFKRHLEGELVAEGSSHSVDEKEAQELFDMMRTYYTDGHKIPTVDDFVDDSIISKDDVTLANTSDSSFAASMNGMDIAPDLDTFINGTTHRTFNNAQVQTGSEVGPTPQMQTITSADMSKSGMLNETIYADDYLEWANSRGTAALESSKHTASSEQNKIAQVEEESSPMGDVPLPKHYMSPLEQPALDPHIAELQETLPGLPMNRIEKVSDEFARTLGYPSIIRLTLAIRENMPEAFSPQCLTRVNFANAKHVMAEAEKEGLVDAHLLNGMLRVHTNSGRIEPALRFYDTEFKKNGLEPTTHSDRLLLEMLVKKRRIARAFKLKEDIERQGRSLDLLSYGTLVEYYGNHNQLGSALLLIKECIGVHGSAPGEKSLKNIRLMCRQNGLTDQVGLEKMVGKDPLEWMRRGEELKRVQNKRGKSSALQYGMNRLVDI